jgi:hypothetical protein
LALLHHADDPYTSVITNTDQNSKQERQAAHKNLKVVQFTGTLPPALPLVVPFRLHADSTKEKRLSDLFINVQGYRGTIRLFLPKIKADGDLRKLVSGLYPKDDFEEFKKWGSIQEEMIEKNQRSKYAYNKAWSKQRLEDIAQTLECGTMFTAGGRKVVGIKRLILEPKIPYTFFLMLDRPRDARIGEAFEIDIVQFDSESRQIVGGLDLRVEIQPQPKEAPAVA